ncbi:MAG: hypothetical protein IPL73_20205 [Candidatus Obscuribacter sp.]|nr:hypothetical protein [Candidatus Obscuribacter sp.]MBK9618696.1 hypothetical protein [Candidatus Obscuribacter sp.]
MSENKEQDKEQDKEEEEETEKAMSNSDMPQDKLAKKSIAGQEDLEKNESVEDKESRHLR